MKNVLLTGVSEYTTRKIINKYLSSNEYRFYCLVPSNSINFDLLKDELHKEGLEAEKLELIIPVTCQIGDDTFVIAKEVILTLKETGIDQIWHFSKLRMFDPYYTRDEYDYYYHVMEQLINLAQECQVKDFLYLSYGYLVKVEESNHGNAIWNARLCADKLLSEFGKNSECKVKIIRSGIIVDCLNENQVNVDSEFYQFICKILKLHDWIKDRAPDYFDVFRISLNVNPENQYDFIEVDHFLDQLNSLICEKLDDTAIFYLKSDFSCNLGLLFSIIDTQLNPFCIQPRKEISDNVQMQQFFYNMLANIKDEFLDISMPYNREAIISPEKTEYYVKKYIAAIRHFQKVLNLEEDESINNMKQHHFKCRDQKDFIYYKTGKGPVVLLINAIGPRYQIWKKIIHKLAEYYTVITWESRGLEKEQDDPTIYNYVEQAKDIGEIMDRERIDVAHFVGWCAGAKFSLEYFKNNKNRILSLTLIASAYLDDEQLETKQVKSIKEIGKVLQKFPKIASKYRKLVKNGYNNEINEMIIEEQNEINSLILEMNNPKYYHLVERPFSTDQHLLNYSILSIENTKFDLRENVVAIDKPILVISAEYDSYIHKYHTQWLLEKITSAKKMHLSDSSHFLIFEDGERIGARILTHIESLS